LLALSLFIRYSCFTMLALATHSLLRDPQAPAPDAVPFPDSVAAAFARLLAPHLPAHLAPAIAELERRASGHAVAVSPPAGGGWLLGLARAAKSLARGERVLWLVPSRGVARLRLAALRPAIEPLAGRMDLLPPGPGARFAAETVDFLMLSYEQAHALLARDASWLAGVGLAVCEGLELLSDPDRATHPALALTLLRETHYPITRLGLSACPIASAFADWWGGSALDLAASDLAPDAAVPALREGTLDARTGHFHWRERRSAPAALTDESTAPAVAAEGIDTLFSAEIWQEACARSAAAAQLLLDEAAALTPLPDFSSLAQHPATASMSGAAGTPGAASTPGATDISGPDTASGVDSSLLIGMFAAALAWAAQGETTLLIAPSRNLARQWALALAQLTLPPPNPPPELPLAWQRLLALEPCADHTLLAQLAARGIGLLHAELSPRARELVVGRGSDPTPDHLSPRTGEPGIANFAPPDRSAPANLPTLAGKSAAAGGTRAARIIIATPSLAAELPVAHNVLVWPWRFSAAPDVGLPGPAAVRWIPLSPADYRAEFAASTLHAPHGTAPRRFMVPVLGAAQATRLWRRLIAPPPEPLHPPVFSADQLPSALLALLAQRPRPAALLAATLSGGAPLAVFPPPTPLQPAVASLATAGLLAPGALNPPDPSAPLRLTPLGHAAARHRLAPATVAALLELQWVAPGHAFTPNAEYPLPALWGLALALPAAAWPCPPSAAPGDAQYLSAYALANPGPAFWPASVRELLLRPAGPGPTERLALEAGWRLVHWLSPISNHELEQCTGWPHGLLARLAGQLAWLARALAALLQAIPSASASAIPLSPPMSPEAPQAWRRLAARLESGLSLAAAPLAPLAAARPGRHVMQQLLAAGFTTPQAIAAASPAALAHLLAGDAPLVARLRHAAGLAVNPRRRGPLVIHSIFAAQPAPALSGSTVAPVALVPFSSPAASAPAPQTPPALELALSSPGIIRVAGREVALAPKAFDLLLKLAQSPGEVCTRDSLYFALWPEGGPEEQQLDAHRRTLQRLLAPALPPTPRGRTPEVVQVVRGYGFRLNLPPAQVKLHH
jgi:DNA-binding winged helix-turn-helix (wHTH) protein